MVDRAGKGSNNYSIVGHFFNHALDSSQGSRFEFLRHVSQVDSSFTLYSFTSSY